MIVDTFLFGWELDLLECRLVELEDIVDLFVVIESDTTFQGNKKELYYLNNRERFAKWNDRIIYVTPELPNAGAWEREFAARNSVTQLASRFSADTVVIHGDVDEIPSKDGLARIASLIRSTNSIYCWCHTMYSMAIDWLYPGKSAGIMGAPAPTFKTMSMIELRHHRYSLGADKIIEDGWHFSWLGGKDLITQKAQAFSHTEDSVQNYVRDMGERLYTEGYHVLQEKLIPVTVDASYPKYIQMGNYPAVWNRPQ